MDKIFIINPNADLFVPIIISIFIILILNILILFILKRKGYYDMENLIKIPTDVEKIYGDEDLEIDMGNLEFSVDKDKQKISAFLFIRNIGIKKRLNFNNCSYNDIEEYLMLFLTKNIEINCDLLATTWLEIFLYDENEDLTLPSLLDKEEIKQFNEDHKIFIDGCRQFINSLPVYAIWSYCPSDGDRIDMSQFETTDFDLLKLANFNQLIKYTHFLLLLEAVPSESHKPAFFNNIFIKENEYELSVLMNNLPYLNMIITMFGGKEIQDEALKRISEILEPDEGGN